MTNCHCVVPFSVEDSTGPKTFYEKERKARKNYRCNECKGTITKGSHYIYTRGLWTEKYKTYRTCMGCYNLSKKLFCNRPAYGWLNDDLQESYGISLHGAHFEEDTEITSCPPNTKKCPWNNSCIDCWYTHMECTGHNVIDHKTLLGEILFLTEEIW